MASTTSLIRELNNTVDKFDSGVKVVIKNVDNAIVDISSTTEKIKSKVEEFKNIMDSGEKKALAHEHILNIEQKINAKLSNYQTIRKTVVGVIKDFDINLVRNSTIQELSEKLWMGNSRYWLSYALIAISAWVQDNKEIADNAIIESLRKDAVKSSLFFCLLALRFGRYECAQKWLSEYFQSIEPSNPPNEASLLLQAYLFGAFGRDKILESKVRLTVDGWVNELKTNKEISCELSESYFNYIDKLLSESGFESAELHSFCSNYSALCESMNNTSKFNVIINNLASLDENKIEKTNENYIARLDTLLDTLVTNYDAEELELRNEQKYYQFLMEGDGNIERAKAQFSEFKNGVDENSNIGRQMLNWAIYSDEKTSTHIRKYAIQKTKDWYINAVESFSAKIKATKPANAQLKIDLWSGSTDGKDRDNVIADMTNKFNAKKMELYIFNKVNIILIIVAILAGFVSGTVALCAHIPLAWTGLAITAVLIITMVLMTLIGLKGFPNRVETAKKHLYMCVEELQRYFTIYDQFEESKNKLIEKLYLM